MIKNYFKTAWRTIWKNKSVSLINIIGLSVGMTAAVFILLWVQNETSYDMYNPDANRIYQVSQSTSYDNNPANISDQTPFLLGETAKKEIPDIKEIARIFHRWDNPALNINGQLFKEKNAAYIDDGWFKIFHYNFVAGNAISFSQNPFGIILTEEKAKKYFGSKNAVGEIIRIDTVNYQVQAVVKNNPKNSSFQFDVLFSVSTLLSNPESRKSEYNPGHSNYLTFLKIGQNANQDLIAGQLTDIYKRIRNNKDLVTTASLTSLKNMHFDTELGGSVLLHTDRKTIYIFSILAILILLIACINYVNLTTASGSLRAREVSVRKIVGAKREQLFAQFIAESLLVNIIALLVALALMEICLPLFNELTGKDFPLPFISFNIWKILLATLVVSTVLNSIYPALLLSSFKPLNVFRGITILKIKNTTFRKSLVVVQFTIATMLIVGTIIIFKQLKFIQKNTAGNNLSQILNIQIPSSVYSKYHDKSEDVVNSSIAHELLSRRGVENVSVASEPVINVSSRMSGDADWEGRPENFNPPISPLNADVNYYKIFNLRMIEGKWFQSNTDETGFILNETAVRQLNLSKPLIGHRFSYQGKMGQVIGIVKDFHYKSFHDSTGAMVIYNAAAGKHNFFIQTTRGNTSEAIKTTETVWAKFVTGEPFDYTFMDESFNNLYKADQKMSALISIFSIIAITISVLGLFGLAAFSSEQRTKEIGIRKVLGASVTGIVSMLSGDFLKPVLLAIVIASPIAWFFMHEWLQDFAYRINIRWWMFALAGFIALFIALFTVSFQAIKAAVANPVDSLRTE